MNFPLNLPKAIEATAMILAEQPGQSMESLRLLKLLYIIERRSIQETCVPMFGSKLVAMKNGPLHSRIYDLIKQQDAASAEWTKYIKTNHQTRERLVSLVGPTPEPKALSRRDIQIIRDVMAEFDSVDTWELVEQTHAFEEWNKAFSTIDQSSSATISVADLLNALNLGECLDSYLANAEEMSSFHDAFDSSTAK